MLNSGGQVSFIYFRSTYESSVSVVVTGLIFFVNSTLTNKRCTHIYINVDPQNPLFKPLILILKFLLGPRDEVSCFTRDPVIVDVKPEVYLQKPSPLVIKKKNGVRKIVRESVPRLLERVYYM